MAILEPDIHHTDTQCELCLRVSSDRGHAWTPLPTTKSLYFIVQPDGTLPPLISDSWRFQQLQRHCAAKRSPVLWEAGRELHADRQPVWERRHETYGAFVCLVLSEVGCSPHRYLWILATDIDPLTAGMVYIQHSLFDAPVEVVIGNPRRDECWRVIYTLVYYMENWTDRLQQRMDEAMAIASL